MPTPSGYHGQSLEKDLNKIRRLYLSGDSAPTIATKLYKDINKKNTVDAAIKSMISGEAPVKIDKPRAATSGLNQFEAVRKDPERLNKILKDIPKMSRREVLEKHNISSDAIGKIIKDNDINFGIIEKGKPQFREYVTENIKTLHNAILKNPEATANQLMENTGLSTRQYNSTVDALQRTYLRDRPGFKPNKKIENNVFDLKSNIPSTFESTLNNPEAVKSITKVRKSLGEFFPGKGTNFEHNLPRTLLSYLDDTKLKDQLLLTGSRTSPELNQFKRIYDIKSKQAVEAFLNDDISLSEYNKKINQIRNDVRKATGGYEIGYLKFDKDKNPTPKVNIEPMTEGYANIGPESNQKIKAFENIQYHENLRKNYLKDPENSLFSTLKKYESNPEAIVDYSDYLKDYKKIEPNLKNQKSILNFAEKNINNKVVRALFKSPYGAAAAVTAAALTPTALMAKTPSPIQDTQTAMQDQAVEGQVPEQKLASPIKYDAYAGFVSPDDLNQKSSQSDLLYWIADNEIPEEVKEIGKMVGEAAAVIGGATVGLGLPDVKKTIEERKAIGKSPITGTLAKGFYRLGSPFATAAFTAPQILDEKTTATDIATDPLNYLGLATMETLGKRAGTIAAPAAAEATGIMGALKNYATLKNVGEAIPGRLSTALRLGLNPRVIAGASRFLGIPGLIASTGYSLYDYLSNKDKEAQ